MAHVVSRRAQWAFYLARTIMVVGATIVPTLVALETRTHGTVETAMQVAAIVLSLLVAVTAGALQVTQMGQRWRLVHQLYVNLEHTGWQLFERRGEYIDGDLNQRFAAFVDRVESILLAFQTEYSSQIARQDRDEGSSDESTLPTRISDTLTPPGTSPDL